MDLLIKNIGIKKKKIKNVILKNLALLFLYLI